MNKRYQVVLTSMVFDTDPEFTTIHRNAVGASDDLEHAFRLSMHIAKNATDYETQPGESLKHLCIVDGDKLVAMAKFMLKGDGPATEHYLEWLGRPSSAALHEWKEQIENHRFDMNRNDAPDFTIEVGQNRISLLEDLIASQRLERQDNILKFLFRAEAFMGLPSSKARRIEDDLGL